jgi:single-strand DNA-binding protein
MSDINVLTLTGRLTRDAEMKTLPTGTELCSFSIASNTGFGQYEKVMYTTVNLWGKTGNKLLKYLVKGKQVGVSGELQVQEWTSKQDGSKQTKNVLSTNSVILLSGEPSKKQPDATDADYEYGEDDIPY